MRVNSFSSRVAELVLCITKRYKLKIVQVYAPTTSSQLHAVVNVKCAHVLSNLSADCLTEFVKSAHTKAMGGKYNEAAHNIVDCKQACLDTVECGGFDFDVKRNNCWLHTSATIRPLVNSTENYNYKRTDSCKTGMCSSNVFVAIYNSVETRLCRSYISRNAPLNIELSAK